MWLLIGISVSLGVAYAPWMASFTETVERRNPALAATGLAIWGLVIRLVIAVSVFFVPHVINTVTTLVEKGGAVAAGDVAGFTPAENATVQAVAADPSIAAKAQTLATKYQAELATAAKIDPATQAALAADPTDQAAGIKAVSEISGVSAADVAKIAALEAQHGPALAAAQKADPAVLAALLTNPKDQAAGIKAISQITGVPVADVTTIATLNAQHGPALAAGRPSTRRRSARF